MAEDNKPMKYMRYAIGEIVLVVLGILIALQINNWNEENNDKQVLNDILQSIANGVQADLRELNLLSSARENITEKINYIDQEFRKPDKVSLDIQEASYINYVFVDILNTVHLNTNMSAFESLKNSIYFGKIQGTDLALLLNTYYRAAATIRSREDQNNQTVHNLSQEWGSHFSINDYALYTKPWQAGDFAIVGPRFLEITRDPHTTKIWEIGRQEQFLIKSYQEQILMGTKLVEMIRNSKTTFDQKTQLELSGILYSFGNADIISLLINGEVPTGFDVRYTASDLFGNNITKVDDYLVIEYPANKFQWGSAYFAVDALRGRVDEMDFSIYSKVVIEMRGEKGGEVFAIAIKDINDPPDGSETQVSIELTNGWQTYEFDTEQFITADMSRIMIPVAFVFLGDIGRKIHLKSIQFK
ncbi:MAG: hypothetical protein HKP09_04905 [Enterobacterales bacterium]|nr:hypothetical protein [Enterobacterales bacterium]